MATGTSKDNNKTDNGKNKIRYGSNGEALHTYKNLSGENVTYDGKGNTYTSYQNSLGETKTYDNNGNKYTTYKNMFGDTVTYDESGNTYVTTKNLFGDQVTRQTKVDETDYYKNIQSGNNSSAKTTVRSQSSGSSGLIVPFHKATPQSSYISYTYKLQDRKMESRNLWQKNIINSYVDQVKKQSEVVFDKIMPICYFGMGLLRVIYIFMSGANAAIAFFSIFSSLIPVIGEVLMLVFSYATKPLHLHTWEFILLRLMVVGVLYAVTLVQDKVYEKNKQLAVKKAEDYMKKAENDADKLIKTVEAKLPGIWQSSPNHIMKLTDQRTGTFLKYSYDGKSLEWTEPIDWKVYQVWYSNGPFPFVEIYFPNKKRAYNFKANGFDEKTARLNYYDDGLSRVFFGDEEVFFKQEGSIVAEVEKTLEKKQQPVINETKKKDDNITPAKSKTSDIRFVVDHVYKQANNNHRYRGKVDAGSIKQGSRLFTKVKGKKIELAVQEIFIEKDYMMPVSVLTKGQKGYLTVKGLENVNIDEISSFYGYKNG